MLFILIQVFDHLELIVYEGQVKFFNMWTPRFSGTNVGVFVKLVDCRYATSGFPLVLCNLCDNTMLCGLLLPCSVCDIGCGCLPPSSSAHLLRVTVVIRDFVGTCGSYL